MRESSRVRKTRTSRAWPNRKGPTAGSHDGSNRESARLLIVLRGTRRDKRLLASVFREDVVVLGHFHFEDAAEGVFDLRQADASGQNLFEFVLFEMGKG